MKKGKELDGEGDKGKEDRGVNEYFRKRLFLKKEMLSFKQSCVVKCEENELARRFKLVLAKKLAEKEGVFEPTSFSLYKK